MRHICVDTTEVPGLGHSCVLSITVNVSLFCELGKIVMKLLQPCYTLSYAFLKD